MVDRIIGLFVYGAIVLALFMILSAAAYADHGTVIPDEFADKGDYADATLIHTDIESVDAMCRKAAEQAGMKALLVGTILGCSFVSQDTVDCIIILPMPSEVPMVDYLAIRRHEMAHCWGWVH